MSEQPQGPGWWRASDGRYYPPEQAPGQPQQPSYGTPQGYVQQPPYGPYGNPQGYSEQPSYGTPQGYPEQPAYGTPPGYGQPQQFAGPPYQLTPTRGGSKVVMVVMIVVLVLVVLPGIGVWLAFRYIGHKAEQIVGSGSCSLVSDATAGNGLGEPVTLRSGTGLGGVVSGLIDSRVLPNAPSCYGTFDAPGGSSSGGLVRVAVYSGSDGKAVFQAEVRRAKGVTVSQQGGTSVQTEPYYGRSVSGVGDEAFCTDLGMSGSVGVLARKGDRLVYSSVTVQFSSASDGASPSPSSSSPVVVPDLTGSCQRAGKLTAAVLGG